MKIKRLLILIFLSFAIFQNQLGAELLDRIIAVVNDEPIMQSELDLLLRPIYEQYRVDFRGEDLVMKLNEARQKLLNQMIEDRLVFQKAEEMAIDPPATMLDERMDIFKKNFKNDIEMEEALRSQGLSLHEIRERFERQAKIKILQNIEVSSKILISPKEIEQFYQENHNVFSSEARIKVRSITIKKSYEAREKGLADDVAKEKLLDIRERISSGENFSNLARMYSEDIQSDDGGLSDWIAQGTMIPVINDVIFKLEIGEVSEPIETPMGHHLFRVEEKESGVKRSLEEVREEIQDRIFRKKSNDRFSEWMQDLKREAYISIR